MNDDIDNKQEKSDGCSRCVKCNRIPGYGCSADACCIEPRGKLYCKNWLEDVSSARDFDTVEVQFKNTRKSYYRNTNGLNLKIGDMVTVEAVPGHDVGEITMVGQLVALQMKRANLRPDFEIKKVIRKSSQSDLDKYAEAKAREHETMIKSRKIAEDLALNMKIGDVEYQGDGGKAIFYYIADERVDFRKLIRVLADEFKVKIEMKQIGARQEAGRIGGIGPCGRPLCCASWLTSFVSVGTSAARFQDISMNPQKLAGQCAKLKCCLNYEVDVYMEAQRKMPSKDLELETKDQTYYHFKSDILKREVIYSTDKQMPVNCVTIDAGRAFEIMALNKRGIKVEKLERGDSGKKETKEFVDLVGQDSLTRFDKSKKKRRNRDRRSSENAERQQRNGRQEVGQQSDNVDRNVKNTIGACDDQRREGQRPRNRRRNNSDVMRKQNDEKQNQEKNK